MSKGFFTINLEDYCRKVWANNPEERNKFLQAVSALKLSAEEESFLVKVFPPDPEDLTDTLNVYMRWVAILRNPASVENFWLNPIEIEKLHFNFELIQDEIFGQQVLVSFFIWLQGSYVETVLSFVNKIGKVVDGDFSFGDVLPPWDSFYQRINLCLWEKYLPEMSEGYQSLLLSGDLLPLFVSMDLNLDDTVRRSVLYFSNIFDRRELSIKFASLIMSNSAPMGKDETGVEVKLSYWIDKFRQLSSGKFDMLKLVEMMNDDVLWKNTDLNEKMIIKNILLVYVSLVTEKYIFFDVDLDNIQSGKVSSLEVPAVNLKDIKEEILKEHSTDKEGDFIDLSAVLSRLQELSDKYNDPTIADLYYFDEQSGEFKWRE